MTEPPHADKTISPVRCAVVTVSDTRTTDTDTSGKLIRDLLAQAGHEVTSFEILPDDPNRVRRHVAALCADGASHAVLLTGGTGVTARDTTYEAIAELLDKRLDGFGERFRTLSFEQIGASAMLSRAVAGVVGRTAVFAMPGSTGAVRLAMNELILPTLGHFAWLLSR